MHSKAMIQNYIAHKLQSTYGGVLQYCTYGIFQEDVEQNSTNL